MKSIFNNLMKVLSSKISLGCFFISSFLVLFLSFYFLDITQVIGNLGLNFLIIEVGSSILISLLFGLFLGTSVYKFNYFRKFSTKKSSVGMVGGFFGVIVSGCPACSITFASYLGLASVIYLLPFYGLELKILSIFLLFYSLFFTLKDLEVCKIKK